MRIVRRSEMCGVCKSEEVGVWWNDEMHDEHWDEDAVKLCTRCSDVVIGLDITPRKARYMLKTYTGEEIEEIRQNRRYR